MTAPDIVRCFVDTEFYEDGSTIDLISLGAVRSDGGEFYAVNQDAKLDRVSQWVRENVLPKLPPYGHPAWMPREVIAKGFSQFLGMRGGVRTPPWKDKVSEIWAYYADYDWVAICQMYGTMMRLPEGFPKYCLDLKQLSYTLGSPKHPPSPAAAHDALADARWNKELFDFLQTVKADTQKIEEGERQMLLMALAHLSVERPGWDDALHRIAMKFDTMTATATGARAAMYDQFRDLHLAHPLTSNAPDDRCACGAIKPAGYERCVDCIAKEVL